jgi:phosphate transport system permease protein
MSNTINVNLRHSPRSRRNLFSLLMTGLTILATVLALLPLFAVIYYLVVNGISQISPQIFTQLIPPRGNGLSNAIAGTITMVGLGAIISVPIGMMAAIYMSEFGGQSNLVTAIGFATNVLSGVPSIIVGVFTFGTVVLATRMLHLGSFSAIAGGIALSIVMLPIIVRTTVESLKQVPQDLRQAAVAIGATKLQTLSVVLPVALPAIISGIISAIARAAGETAPLIFTALSNQYFAKSLLDPTASLSVTIYTFATAPFIKQQQLAWAASLVLVGIILIISIAARLATRLGGSKSWR